MSDNQGGRLHCWFGLAGVSLLVFGAGLDNGFISDDYVFLQRVEDLLHHPLLLFGIPPENFRSTTYLVFLSLKSVFGYQAIPFYLFTTLLHSVNALLAGRLAAILGGDPRIAVAASFLFVSFQNPQEAILWLGGMHELLAGFFLMLCLLLWARDRHYWSLLAYGLALFSKESAPVVLLLIPVTEVWRGRRFVPNRAYLFFWGLTGLFGLLFLSTASSNSLIGGGFYSFGPRALLVLVKSLHKLAFPWLYLAIAAALVWRLPFNRRRIAAASAWAVVALLPYVFLTYQDHVPSRHEYLASFGVAAGLASLGRDMWTRRAGIALLIGFVLSNAGYVWFAKDPQFERRAAPTEKLLSVLEAQPPGPLRIESFPLNPWIAKLTAPAVPGWRPTHLHVAPLDPDCAPCPLIRWDPESETYVTVDR